MSDAIKVEELKMFVGTGLKFEHHDLETQPYIDRLDGIHRGEMCLRDCDECEIGDPEWWPLVRPLSSLKIEDYKKWENIDLDIPGILKLSEVYQKFNSKIDVLYSENRDNHFDVIETIYVKRPMMNLARNVMSLASLRFDIFNWIGRGLAKEITIETK